MLTFFNVTATEGLMKEEIKEKLISLPEMHQFAFMVLSEKDRTFENIMQIASLSQEQVRLFVRLRKQSRVATLNAIAKLSQMQIEILRRFPKNERSLETIEELLVTAIATERVLFFIKSDLGKNLANLKKISSLLDFMFDILKLLPAEEVTSESLDALYKLELNQLQIVTWFHLPKEERTIAALEKMEEFSNIPLSAWSYLPKREQTIASLKRMDELSVTFLNAWFYLPREEKDMDHLNKFSQISDNQMNIWSYLAREKESFPVLEKFALVAQARLWIKLPEDRRDDDNLEKVSLLSQKQVEALFELTQDELNSDALDRVGMLSDEQVAAFFFFPSYQRNINAMTKIGYLGFEKFEDFKVKLKQGLSLNPQNFTDALDFFHNVPVESDCLYHEKDDPEIMVFGEIDEGSSLLFGL